MKYVAFERFVEPLLVVVFEEEYPLQITFSTVPLFANPKIKVQVQIEISSSQVHLHSCPLYTRTGLNIASRTVHHKE